MTVLMILQDGPLDGEQQVVENLNTTPGWEMTFNIPNFQTFDAAGHSVVGMGLVAVYSYLKPGRAPNPGPPNFDTWTTSWIYEFTGEYFIPQPGPIVPPGPQPLPPAVFMNALSSMAVNANDPSAGVQMSGEGVMEIDATTTSVGYASIAMTAETTMVIFRQTWGNSIAMSASSSMTVTPN